VDLGQNTLGQGVLPTLLIFYSWKWQKIILQKMMKENDFLPRDKMPLRPRVIADFSLKRLRK
jgi:hypothetical protein